MNKTKTGEGLEEEAGEWQGCPVCLACVWHSRPGKWPLGSPSHCTFNKQLVLLSKVTPQGLNKEFLVPVSFLEPGLALPPALT